MSCTLYFATWREKHSRPRHRFPKRVSQPWRPGTRITRGPRDSLPGRGRGANRLLEHASRHGKVVWKRPFGPQQGLGLPASSRRAFHPNWLQHQSESVIPRRAQGPIGLGHASLAELLRQTRCFSAQTVGGVWGSQHEGLQADFAILMIFSDFPRLRNWVLLPKSSVRS